MSSRLLGMLGLTFLGSCASSRNLGGEYFDIGKVGRRVSTASREAQVWFDRGLAMTFGFNHEEAVRCYERVMALDSSCAMAHWGKAYALGPNVNNASMDEATSKSAFEAVQRALELKATVTLVECDLIQALSNRYQWPAPADRKGLDRQYADAMREVHREHPDDADVAALFAESLLVLHPWKWWSKDGAPQTEIPEAIEVIEGSLARWPAHPALCHLYIHAVEMSPHPERALAAADRLRSLVPGAGHLVHMPAHIDLLLGDYRSAIESNQRALEADRKFVAREGRMNFYTIYRVHNYHFVAYSAMFDGQSAVAMAAARELVREVPAELVQKSADFVEAFLGMPLHVLVRFGKWSEILMEPAPPKDWLVTTAHWRYSRGLAYAALGRVEDADRELAAFTAAYANVPDTRTQFNNSARQILGIAESMLHGEVDYRKGHFDAAFEHLREAARRDDSLHYDEPWAWAQPARHALGALLLEQGRLEEAAKVYHDDLRLRPNNPWSLHGLAECQERLGDASSAAATRAVFVESSKRADVEIHGSCYCRVGG